MLTRQSKCSPQVQLEILSRISHSHVHARLTLPHRHFSPASSASSTSSSPPLEALAHQELPNITRRQLIYARYEELADFAKVDRSQRPFPFELHRRINSLLTSQHFSKRIANLPPTEAARLSNSSTASGRLTVIRNTLSSALNSDLSNDKKEDSGKSESAEVAAASATYNHVSSLKYVADELPLSFAAQRAVLLEVKRRLPEWTPDSILDFGAGPGTTLWAAMEAWHPDSQAFDSPEKTEEARAKAAAESARRLAAGKRVRLYTAVEPSESMQKFGLSLTAGLETRRPSAETVAEPASSTSESGAAEVPTAAQPTSPLSSDATRFVETSWRRTLPEKLTKHSLVVASYSLSELPNSRARKQALAQLWTLVEEGGCLVVVERGSAPGFQIVLEARDYILNRFPPSSNREGASHVVAPCPHDGKCMFARPSLLDSEDEKGALPAKVDLDQFDKMGTVPAIAPNKATSFCHFTAQLLRSSLPGRSSLFHANEAGRTSIPSAFGATLDATMEASASSAVVAASALAARDSKNRFRRKVRESPVVVTPYSYVVLRKAPSPRLLRAGKKVESSLHGWYPAQSPRDLLPAVLVNVAKVEVQAALALQAQGAQEAEQSWLPEDERRAEVVTDMQADQISSSSHDDDDDDGGENKLPASIMNPAFSSFPTGSAGGPAGAGREAWDAYFRTVRAEAAALMAPDELSFFMSRVILPPQKRKQHVRIDLCSAGDGSWQRHVISPSKIGKIGYHAARKSHWGDLWVLPLTTSTDQTPRYQPSAREQRVLDAVRAQRQAQIEKQRQAEEARVNEIADLEAALGIQSRTPTATDKVEDKSKQNEDEDDEEPSEDFDARVDDDEDEEAAEVQQKLSQRRPASVAPVAPTPGLDLPLINSTTLRGKTPTAPSPAVHDGPTLLDLVKGKSSSPSQTKTARDDAKEEDLPTEPIDMDSVFDELMEGSSKPAPATASESSLKRSQKSSGRKL